MVGLMATESRERVANLLDSINFASTIPSKLRYLHELKAEFSSSDVILLSEFLTGLLKLLSDQFSPVRKFVAEMVGEVGSSHFELLPEIVPALMTVFDDDAPAVSRQAISSATHIFLSTLEKVALQGLSTSELDDSLQEAWAWMTKMKGRLYSIAFQSGSDGRRVLSLKFVKSVILIYTPDPSGSSEPPIVQANEGKPVEINMSWLRKGHPLLNVGDLSVEASERLRLLVDQLRTPTVKSLSVSMMIVLVNSLSVVATKRPSFYGRILPVLLGLDASSSVIKGFHAYGLQNALKNAFLSCLKCTYSSARPWRDRLVGALKEMKAGELADLAVEEICSVNGKVKEEEIDFPITQEEPSPTMTESVQLSKGRKRSGDQQFGETSEDDDTPGKRFKSTPLVEGSPRLSNTRVVDEGATSNVQPIVRAEDDSGPAQQLVALFGALVAQGEKAAAHLDILIASIATDMLAEVVIANMKHLPSACPNAEADDEASTSSGSCPSLLESDSRFRQLSLFLSNAISAASPQKSSEMDVQQPSSHDMKEHYVKEEPLEVVADEHDGVNVLMDESVDRTLASSLPLPSDVGGFSEVGKGFSSLTVGFQDVENTNAGIPGLDNASNDILPGLETSTSLVATDLDDGSQDLDTSLVKISKVESLPSVSTDRSEESCAKAVVADANSGVASTATSLRSIQQFVLPKVAAPVIDLTDEEKDEIQKVSFARIVKAYKQVAISGGSHLHFSLLACLGVEFPLDLDPWAIIQEHILSDYVNHEGHELTLLVLYKLYKEAEERDFFSSTTATSVYEMFLLKVAETLRDSFPSSDKSLSRLLGEVPYLPKTIFDLLEGLCCPDIKGKDDKESQIGDRVTQGLSTVWSLILSRPPLRDVLLKIALQSAVYHVEEVRMKAIRLVANKLYPLSSISIQIEDFAKNMLDSVVKEQATTVDAEKSSNQSQKNCDNAPHSSEDPSSDAPKDISNAHQAYTSKDTPNMLISEARKCMSLYFALCTKKHSLLRQMFIIYKISPAYVKQTIHSQMPILIRTIGASPMVLEIISNPPEGSESLLMEVLHTLTDGALPSPQLINAVKCFYESKKKDVEILFPILSFLPKEEVVQIFPSLVNLPAERFQAALPRLLQGSAPSGPILTPEEVLIAIHGIDPDKDRIPLKKVTEACNACFEQRQIFTQQVLAKVLNQLVEQIPLPLLFMRTVLQAVGAFPALVDFIMGILSRLVNKQIWKFPKLWVGFLKCAQLTQPHSFNVLLQVPSAQLEGALNKIPALKAPLVGHASQPEVRSTLTRSTLVVLGLVTESSQNVSPAQTVAPSETTDGGGSEKESTTERSKESSSN